MLLQEWTPLLCGISSESIAVIALVHTCKFQAYEYENREQIPHAFGKTVTWVPRTAEKLLGWGHTKETGNRNATVISEYCY
jgi:hypothetical protein